MAPAHTILLVEDEPDVVDLLALNLRKAGGFHLLVASDGANGLTLARAEQPAIIILDIMLPAMSGLEVCRILKGDAKTAGIPILMLTAKAQEADRIAGLELGADDYVTKPFSPREVVLRLRALLRRGTPEPLDGMLKAGGIAIDTVRHEVFVRGVRVVLTSIEFKLLHTLLKRRGRLQERDRLLADVWGYENSIDTRTVDTHIRRLRAKLKDEGEAIETVRGFGYRFREK